MSYLQQPNPLIYLTETPKGNGDTITLGKPKFFHRYTRTGNSAGAITVIGGYAGAVYKVAIRSNAIPYTLTNVDFGSISNEIGYYGRIDIYTIRCLNTAPYKYIVESHAEVARQVYGEYTELSNDVTTIANDASELNGVGAGSIFGIIIYSERADKLIGIGIAPASFGPPCAYPTLREMVRSADGGIPNNDFIVSNTAFVSTPDFTGTVCAGFLVPNAAVNRAGDIFYTRYSYPKGGLLDGGDLVKIAFGTSTPVIQTRPSLPPSTAHKPIAIGIGYGNDITYRSAYNESNQANYYGAPPTPDLGNNLYLPGTAGTYMGPEPVYGTLAGYGSFAVDSDGNLYSATGNVIWKFPLGASTPVLFAGDPTAGYANGQGTAARFNGINSICMDANDNIYALDQFRMVRRIDRDANVTLFAGDPGSLGHLDGSRLTAAFEGAVSITCDRSRNHLYILEKTPSIHRIRKIS